jgi:propionyl-CoA carboxylase alpha chain
MFYDPMICKLVTYGATRDDALDRLRGALDAYVITGVGHNIPFLRDLTEHSRFISGNISTQFIGEEYPKGFKGVVLSDADRLLLAAGTAVMHAIREETMCASTGEIIVTLGPTEGSKEEKGPSFTARVTASASKSGLGRDWTIDIAPTSAANAQDAQVGGSRIQLDGVKWVPSDPVLFAKIRGSAAGGSGVRARASAAGLRLQAAARLPDGFAVVFKGAAIEAHVRTPRQHELGAHMLPKAKADFSQVLVSPMPGRLVSVAVAVGSVVEMGQELAVVEAMKMANVLRSHRRGVVKAVRVKAGATLAVDEVIIEFEAS